MLPVYENELKVFQHKIDSLKNTKGSATKNVTILENANVIFESNTYKISEGTKLFSDTSLTIKNYAAELTGLKGAQSSFKQQMKQGTELSFSNDKPVKVLGILHLVTSRSPCSGFRFC